MGKRITQQARGKGSLTFRVRKRAYRHKVGYPKLGSEGVANIIKLFNSSAHSTPLIKINVDKESFIVPAADGVYEGQEIHIGQRSENSPAENGDIVSGRRIGNPDTLSWRFNPQIHKDLQSANW